MVLSWDPIPSLKNSQDDAMEEWARTHTLK